MQNGAPLSNFLARLLEQANMRTAVAGDGLGNLEVTDRPNFIYVRIGGADGAVTEVRTGIVRPNDGDYIFIAREQPFGTTGWRSAFWLRDSADPTLPAPVVGSPYVL